MSIVRFIISLFLNPVSAGVVTGAVVVVSTVILLGYLFPLTVPEEYQTMSLENCKITDVINESKKKFEVICE